MNEQEKIAAVEKAEELLISTQDTIADVIRAIVFTPELGDVYGLYTCRKTLQKAFHKKHGMGMSVWRKKRTGISDHQYKSMDVARRLAGRMELVKKLLINTHLSQISIARLASVTPCQILTYLKRDGMTSKSFRERHCDDANPNVYMEQPATRRRYRVNGGMRLVTRESGGMKCIHRLDHNPGKAVLSLSVVGLSFSVTEVGNTSITTKRIEVKDAIMIKTGFLEPTKDIETLGTPLAIPSPFNSNKLIRVVVVYNLLENRLEFLCNRSIDRVSFTLNITETEL